MSNQIFNGPIGNQGSQGPDGSSLLTSTGGAFNLDTPYMTYNLSIPNNITATNLRYLNTSNSLAIGFTITNNGFNTIIQGSNNSGSGSNNLILGGSSSTVNGFQNAIIGSQISTINNSQQSVIISGTNNSIVNSTNCFIVGSNSTITNSQNSIALGKGSGISHKNSFVWSDNTPRFSFADNSTTFGSAGGFYVNVNGTSGLTITVGAMQPLTDAVMTLGSSTSRYKNLYLAANAGLYVSPPFQITNTSGTTLMTFTATQITANIGIAPITNSMYTLGNSTGTGRFSSVYFNAVNGGGLYYGVTTFGTPAVMTFSLTGPQTTIYRSLVPTTNGILNMGTTTTFFDGLYLTTINSYDSCVFTTTGATSLVVANNNLITWTGKELNNVMSPSNITISAQKTNIVNTSTAIRNWRITLEMVFSQTATNNRTEVWINKYNSSSVTQNSFIAHNRLYDPGTNTVLVQQTSCTLRVLPGEYINAWMTNTTGTVTFNPIVSLASTFQRSRLYIAEI